MILFLSGVAVFNRIFRGSIYWGDLPYFFSEELTQFWATPQVWTSYGNNFGGVNLVIWLWPIMSLWRLLGPQLLFIIPSLILSIVGPIFLTRYLKMPPLVQFFTSAVYTFNTYFLLLIDGGQAGVALSYGLFPLTVLFLIKLVDKSNLKSFFVALALLLLNGLADPRITLIAVVTAVVWSINKIKRLPIFAALGICWLFLNAFWLYPFVMVKGGLSTLSQIDIPIVKLVHAMTLFSPHWPDNLFGNINEPYFYFWGIPILIFANLLFLKNSKGFKSLVIFLLFATLSIFPMGIIFRDSTKFFVPLILFAGILIGKTAQGVNRKIFSIAIFMYLLFLVHPTILGRMNFVLSDRAHSSDFTKIYENLRMDSGFFRTVWFPERHPLSFGTEEKPAIDAKELVRFPVFADMNVGEDPFNFLNNPNFVDRFRVLGIKYLILSGNPREITKSEKDEANWDDLVQIVDQTPGLEKVDWGVSVPIYKITNSYPQVFSTEKIAAVVGGRLDGAYPAVYLEDGLVDPAVLADIDSDSALLFFNGGDKKDLAMSFLQNYFIFPKNAVKSQWAVFGGNEYLKYKYQFLIRGVELTDLDYGGGIAFSTVKGEEMTFSFTVPEDDDYLIAIRQQSPEKGEKHLIWNFQEVGRLSKGEFVYTVTNNESFKVVNAIALTSPKRMEEADKLAEEYLKKFNTASTLPETKNFSENRGPWLIFTDNYHPLWKAKVGDNHIDSIPVYSMVNGFYLGEDKSNRRELEFLGQRYFETGLLVSLASLATLIVTYVFLKKFGKQA